MEKLIEHIGQEEDIIIVSNKYIKPILIQKFSNQMRKITFKSFDEVKDDIYTTIDYQMLFHNMKEDTNLEVLRIKLANSYFIQQDSNEPFLHELYLYHQNNHLILDENHLSYYKSKKVYFVNYYGDDDLINQMLPFLKHYERCFTTNSIDKELTIFHFENYDDEILEVVNHIAILLNKKVDPAKIVIHKVNKDYLNKLEEYLMIYKIDYIVEGEGSFFDVDIVKNFFHDLKNYEAMRLNKVLKDYLIDKKDNKIFSKIGKVLEPLIMLDLTINSITLDLIKDVFIHTIYQEEVTNAIKIENVLNHIYDDDTHIFIMNFSHGEIAHIYKDDTYLNDKIRKNLKLLTSFDRTQIEEKKILDCIHSYESIHLSYSTYCSSKIYMPSNLIKKLAKKRIVNICDASIHIYHIVNEDMAKMRFFKAYALYRLYQKKTFDYLYGYTYFCADLTKRYQSDFNATLDYLALPTLFMELSYTKLNDYFSCPFRFYLKYILNIEEKMEDNNSTFVGRMYHFVLEKVVAKRYIDRRTKEEVLENISVYICDFVKNQTYEIKDKLKFYLNKFSEELKLIVEIIMDFMDHSSFEVLGLEQKLEKQLDDYTVVVGLIDKILKYQEYYLVIDYKTNPVHPNWYALDVGLDLQLPLYLYLIKANDPNAKIAGSYLQSVFRTSLLKYEDKPLSKVMLEQLKYVGYTLQDRDVILAIDTNALNGSGSLPKQIVSNKGFYKNFLKKSFTQTQFDAIILYVEKLIFEANKKIRKGLFPILPLTDEKNESVCRYCRLKDLCYRNETMKKVYKKHDDFSYLFEGGSDDDQLEC
ncbi:MAG: PD-(D/E)XK nuclease family protein [Bacilli bacterium]|nr:PD-(D/E)XK nuclease family protein [Bacilli bacterium]